MSAETDQRLARMEWKLDLVIRRLRRLTNMEEVALLDMSALRAEVSRETDLNKSIIALLVALHTQLQEALDRGADPAELQAIIDELKNDNDATAAAVIANTPAAPPADQS